MPSLPKPREQVDAAVIPLTMGYVAIVDRKNFEWLSKWAWRACIVGNNVYAGYSQPVSGRQIFVAMHQLLVGDVPEGHLIFHRNGLGIDNRLSNLLVAPRGTKAFLHGPPQRSRFTQFRGIQLKYKAQNGTAHWQAVISINGKRRCLGVFSDEIEAAIAWDKEVVRYYGADACVNFPDKMDEYVRYAKENPPSDARPINRYQRPRPRKSDGGRGRQP